MEQKKIKICGLTRMEDIDAVNEYLPDYVGFVFAPGKRQVSFSTASLLKSRLSPKITPVGVFFNSPVEEIARLAAEYVIELIQLHGDEDQSYIEKLNNCLLIAMSQAGTTRWIPIIKAVRVNSQADILRAQKLQAEYLLLDSYVKSAYGGSGKSFDWSLIPSLEKPWFLAGGIGLSNIEEAKKTEAFCLDVSSAVETDGKKDPEKIKAVIQMIRNETAPL